jgi:hypothetical protein
MPFGAFIGLAFAQKTTGLPKIIIAGDLTDLEKSVYLQMARG